MSDNPSGEGEDAASTPPAPPPAPDTETERVVDLSGVTAGNAGTIGTLREIVLPSTENVTVLPPKRRTGNREEMRGTLAVTLLIFYGFLLAVVCFFIYKKVVTITDVASLLIPLPTLLGTALGFYFGHEAALGEAKGKPQN